MATPSVTRATLLLKIRDPADRIAWNDFVQLYAPLIHAYGLRRGLQDADSADLVQEVLGRVSRSMPRFEYDRTRGTFRGWLLTVTRNEIRKMAERKPRQAIGSGDTQMHGFLEQAEEPPASDSEWDHEYHWRAFLWAAERVKPEFRENTWHAFWRTVVGSEDSSQVASDLKLSLGAVYIARSRVTARIKQELESTLDE